MESEAKTEQSSQHKAALMVQIREAYGRVVYTYTAHNKLHNRITANTTRIKLVQILLAAISTGGFLGSAISNEAIATWIGGICATLLLAVNLYFKDFNSSEQIAQHRKAADSLWLIREQYISLLTDFSILTNIEMANKRDELQSKTYEVYKQSPKTDAKSYAATQKALKCEEEQFFTPEEIDKMLPSHLRSCKGKGGQ